MMKKNILVGVNYYSIVNRYFQKQLSLWNP